MSLHLPMTSASLRLCVIFVVVVASAVSFSACKPEEHAAHAALDNSVAQEARPYWELRLTPPGTGSGFADDLDALRVESLEDRVTFEGTDDNIDLSRRAKLRAFEGAPPVIPHTVRSHSAPECLACHNERLEFRGRKAQPICHTNLSNCTQCHVMSAGRVPGGEDLPRDPRVVENTFVGLRPQIPIADRVGVPPRVPHRTFMRERCQSCHGQNGPGAGHHPVDFEPKRTLPASFALTDDGRLQCLTCHKVSGGVPSFDATTALTSALRDIPTGSDLCLSCHEDAHAPVFTRLGLSNGAHLGGSDLDKILSERMPAGKAQSGCLGCHGSHGALQQGVLRTMGEARVCGVCHADRAFAEQNHPVGIPRPSEMKVPDDIPSGGNGGPICRSCHDVEGGTRSNHLVRAMKSGASLCMSCHENRVEAMRGPHGKVKEGLREPCFGCHQVHGTSRDKHLLVAASRATAADPMGCLGCHGKGGPAAPKDAYPGTEGHPVDGKLHQGMKDALTCVSCHDAHDPNPKSVDCGKCHADKAEAFARGGHATAECLDCHPIHRAVPRAAIADVNPAGRRCLACHDAQVGKPNITRVAEYQHPAPMFTPGGTRWEPLGALPLFGPDGKPAPAGANGDLTCSTCHHTHGPDVSHPADKLRRPGWQGVCSACHGDDTLTVYRYFHKRDRLNP